MENTARLYFEFIVLMERLQKLERFTNQKYWNDYPIARKESVADHSWRLALLVMLVADKLSEPIDVCRAMKIALVHDIPEIYAGDSDPIGASGNGSDTHAYNDTAQQKKFAREDAAAKDIFGMLPDIGDELYALWREYEAKETWEARVVKALDKIDGYTTTLTSTGGAFYPEHLEFNLKFGPKYSETDPFITQLSNEITAEIKKQYRPFEK